MKKFQELLMKDFGWKLLSLVIAIVMWFMVINISQPVETRSYTKAITLENMNALTDRGLTVQNEAGITSTNVTIRIRAQRTSLDRLSRSLDWLSVTVDLSPLAYTADGETVSLPVNVSMQDVYSGYTIVSKSPAAVDVVVERIDQKEFPVEVVIEGELPEDAMYTEPVLSHETVTATGAASAVEQIAAVRATVTAAEIADGAVISSKLTAYNMEGAPVRGVTLSAESVTLSYSLLEWKTVPIQVNIIGDPGEGYSLGETQCLPSMAEVTGEAEVLEDFIYLQLPDIDISNATSPVRRSYILSDYLPEGISSREGSSYLIQVTVDITGEESATVTLDSDRLSVDNGESGKSYAINGTVTVTLNGDREMLSAISREDIRGSVDVSGLEAGQHIVLVQLDLPEGVTASAAQVTVMVTDNAAEENEIS